MKKLISLILAASFALSMSVNAFAYHPKETDTPVSVSTETCYVEAEDGTVIPVTITEKVYNPNGISTYSSEDNPEVGSYRTFTIDISNDYLSATAIVGRGISERVAKELGKAAADTVLVKLGSNIIPGLNLAARIAEYAMAANIIVGNEGFEVTVRMEYEHYINRKEGYDLYAWGLYSLDVDTY